LLTAFATSQKTVSVGMICDVARDLKIIPEARFNEHRSSEAVESTQARSADVDSVASKGGEVAAEGIHQAEDRERPRLASVGASAVTAEGVAHAPRRSPELRDLRREYGRPVPVGNSRKAEKTSAADHSALDAGKVHHPTPIALANRGAPVVDRRQTTDGGSEEATLPPAFLDRVVVALTEAMGPMGPFVVKSVAAALGESLERFPAKRMNDLLLRLKGEILSEGLREAFEAQIAKDIDRHVSARSR
jgi:hypothetical protein